MIKQIIDFACANVFNFLIFVGGITTILSIVKETIIGVSKSFSKYSCECEKDIGEILKILKEERNDSN